MIWIWNIKTIKPKCVMQICTKISIWHIATKTSLHFIIPGCIYVHNSIHNMLDVIPNLFSNKAVQLWINYSENVKFNSYFNWSINPCPISFAYFIFACQEFFRQLWRYPPPSFFFGGGCISHVFIKALLFNFSWITSEILSINYTIT